MEFFNTEFDDSFVSKGNHLTGHRLTPGKCRKIIDEIRQSYGMDCGHMAKAMGTKGYNYCYGHYGK